MDVLSWISLTVIAAIALALAARWLQGRLVRHEHGGHRAYSSGYAYGTLVLACLVLLAVEGVADVGVKETVFDGWLDSAVDAVDGTDDREEWIARHREDGSRDLPPAA